MTGIGELKHEQFEPLVGDTFRVRSPDGETAEFALVEARDVSDTMRLPDGHRTPFSLFFRPSVDITWPQGQFTFEHDGLGSFDAFCSAVMDPDRPGLPAYEVTVA